MHNTRSAATMAAVALGSLLAFSPLSAQSSDVVKTKGLMFGLHLNGSSIKFEGEDETGQGLENNRDTGVGAGAQIGWGFTKWFMLYAGADAAKVEIKGFSGAADEDIAGDYTLIHGDIGARFSFPSPNHGFAPYLNAALTTRVATAEVFDEDVSFSGNGVSFGGGLMYFFNPKWALDVGVQVTAGKFNEVEIGPVKIDLDDLPGVDLKNTNSARFNVGMKFFPHFGKK
jgi:hypothetical protein